MGDLHFSAEQSKATNPPSHNAASRSPTRPVPAKHPLNHPLLKLQQSIGNQGVQRLLHSQPVQGLRPSQGGLLQRKCACGGTPGLDGECAECRQKRLRRQRHPTSQPEAAALPPIVHEVLRSPGRSLDPQVQSFMEPRFGHDFSRVRVHTDVRAAESAKAMNALAYTVGQDVVFGPGQYVPGTVEGKRLLAHELTHTMQQGIQSPNISGLKLAAANDAPEQEARRAENQFVAGNSSSRIGVAPVQTSVQRACGPKEIGEVSGCIGRGGDVSDFGSTGEDLFLFQVDCDLFQPGEKARLEEYAREIGPEEIVAIDGFASEEGMPEFNERLSCARAHAAASVLFAAGVQPSQVEIYMHGATPGILGVRRSVVITVIPAVPAGPTPAESAPTSPPPPTLAGYDPLSAPAVYERNTELGGLSVGNFDFHFRGCTILVWVDVRFQFESDITPAEQVAFKSRFTNAVHNVWAHTGWSLTGSPACPCSTVPIEIHVEESTSGFYHKLVDVERDGERREFVGYDINVNLSTSDYTLSHEFGHVLGLYDEYDGGFWENNYTFWHRNRPDDPNALMNEGTQLRSRYFEHYRSRVQETERRREEAHSFQRLRGIIPPTGCTYRISSPVPPVP